MVGEQGDSYHPPGRQCAPHGGDTSMLKEQKGGAGPGVPGAGGDGHIKTEGMKEEAGAMKDEPGERAVEGIKDDPESDLVPPQPLQNGQLDSGYSTGMYVTHIAVLHTYSSVTHV